MEARFVEMIFAFCWHGRCAEVIAWMESLGCEVLARPENERNQWTLRGPSGIAGGILFGLDPPALAAQFGLLFFGLVWPHILPRLMDRMDAEWKRLKKEAGQPAYNETNRPPQYKEADMATTTGNGGKTKLRNPRMIQSTLGRIAKQHGVCVGRIYAELTKLKALGDEMNTLEGEFAAWNEARATGGKHEAGGA